MSWSNGPKMVRDGLVLYLDAANPRSYPGNGISYYNLTLNGYTGSLRNSPEYLTNSFSFNPTLTQYVSFNPSILNGAVYGTVSVWFKRNAWYNTRYDTIFTKSNGGNWVNNHIQINRNNTADTLTLTISDNISSTSMGVTTPNILEGVWYNVAMTWNGTVLIGYMNGIEIDRYNTNIALPTNSTYFGLAQGAAGTTDRYFSGSIGPFMCYDFALNSNQILQNFEALKGRFGL